MKKTVRVNGRSVDVATRKLRGNVLGRAYVGGKKRPRIFLHGKLRSVRRISTLIHEMIHHLDMTLPEAAVLRLEAGIVELVHDNPELFFALAHELTKEDPE